MVGNCKDLCLVNIEREKLINLFLALLEFAIGTET